VHRDNFVSWQGGLRKLIKSNVNAKLSHLTAKYPHAPPHVCMVNSASEKKVPLSPPTMMRAFNYTQCCVAYFRGPPSTIEFSGRGYGWVSSWWVLF